jgi:uncharacterized membrane protein YtjA (UPF0391 family)
METLESREMVAYVNLFSLFPAVLRFAGSSACACCAAPKILMDMIIVLYIVLIRFVKRRTLHRENRTYWYPAKEIRILDARQLIKCWLTSPSSICDDVSQVT